MGFLVTLTFQDSRGRETQRSLWCVQAALADAQTAVGSLTSLWNPLTDLAIVRATYTFDEALAIAGAAVSNIDEGVSLSVTTDANRKRNLNLPDPPDAKTPDGLLASADSDLVAFMANLETGGLFRLNPAHPEYAVSWAAGVLNK